MEHNRNAKVRSGFPQKRQPGTEQPAAQKCHSPSDPHQAPPDSNDPQNLTGEAQPGHSHPQADHGAYPTKGSRLDIKRPSSMEHSSRAGPPPVDRPFPPIKEQRTASDHTLRAGSTPYGVKMESKTDGNGHAMQGGYHSRSRAPTPSAMSGPPGPTVGPQALTSVGSQFPAQGPRNLPVRSTYGFGHIPAKRGYGPNHDSVPNEVSESDAGEDNLVDPAKPVQITVYEPTYSPAKVPGNRSHTPFAPGDLKGYPDHVGQGLARLASDDDRGPVDTRRMLPPLAQGFPGGPARPYPPQIPHPQLQSEGPIGEAFRGFPRRHDQHPSAALYRGDARSEHHLQADYPSSLRRELDQPMGSDPSILNSSMEEEMDLGYASYLGVDAYEYAKPGIRGGGGGDMRGPTFADQGSLRYPNDAPPFPPAATFGRPYHQPAKTGMGPRTMDKSAMVPQVPVKDEGPLFARAKGFKDHFELVKQIDIAATHAKARKLAGGFDETRTWGMSRDFLDNQVRLNEDLEKLMEDFHNKLDGLIQYKDSVLQQKVARTGQYNQAVAQCRRGTDSLFEDTQRYMGLGSKRRKMGV